MPEAIILLKLFIPVSPRLDKGATLSSQHEGLRTLKIKIKFHIPYMTD